MKVPFLNKRIENEFLLYIEEFGSGIKGSLSDAKKNASEKKLLFARTFPLFVLLRCLASPSYARNPAMEAVLGELRQSNNKARTIEALAFFRREMPFQEELFTGVQRSTFTGYFDELFSDALLLLNSFYARNYRGAFVAVRCMLEDTYRHLFYKDHPEEFDALHGGGFDEREMGLSPVRLREYLARTSYLAVYRGIGENFLKKLDGKEGDLFSLNDELYKECSGHVHGSSMASLNAFRSNSDFVENEERANQVVKVVEKFVKVSVSFLISAHLDHVLAADEYERSMILSAFSDSERAAFRRALNI